MAIGRFSRETPSLRLSLLTVRLRMRHDKRADIHEAFLSLGARDSRQGCDGSI